MRESKPERHIDLVHSIAALLRRRLHEIDQGVPVAEAWKLHYEDLRKSLLLDYRIKGEKSLEEDENGEPYIWGLQSHRSLFPKPAGSDHQDGYVV